MIVTDRDFPGAAYSVSTLRPALVLPASPSFYSQPTTLDAALDTVLARVLDHLGIAHELGKRWGQEN